MNRAKPRPRERLMRRPWRSAAPWALAWGMALALGACGDVEEYELKGKLGPGEGGPAVNEGALESHDLSTLGGETVIGTVEFDSSALLHFHPDPEDDSLHVVANVPPEDLLADLADNGELDGLGEGDVVIFITPIFGRPDTPCRFQAALLARDDGYGIQGSGDRKTDRGLELHQVNLIKRSIPLTQRLYCYELKEPFGAQITVYAVDREHQEWRIVHAVLNSIERK